MLKNVTASNLYPHIIFKYITELIIFFSARQIMISTFVKKKKVNAIHPLNKTDYNEENYASLLHGKQGIHSILEIQGPCNNK